MQGFGPKALVVFGALVLAGCPKSGRGATSTRSTSASSTSSSGSGPFNTSLCAHPNPLDFGNVQVLGTPATLLVTICNCGEEQASVTLQGVEGAQSSDFTVSGPSGGAALPPNGCETLTVSYRPAAMGASTANLLYVACPTCTSETMVLTGVGVDGQLTFSPSPVSFGSPAAGSMTPVQVLGTNTGTEDLTVTALGTASDAGAFVLSAPSKSLPITLAPLEDFTLTVTYNAPDGGLGGGSDQLLGTFTVADATVAPRTEQDWLTAFALPGPCTLGISPASVNFGNVSPHTVITKQVTLTDDGTAACAVSGIAVSTGADAGFALGAGQATALTVQPGSPQQITVTFSADSDSPLLRKGELTFQTGDITNPIATVPLSAAIEGQTCYCGGWPKWHMDSFNSGQSTADTSGLIGNVAWKYLIGPPDAGGTYVNSPVIDELGNVYELGMSGTFYAVAPGGTQVWQQPLSSPAGDPTPSTPAILADGSIVVGIGSGGSQNLYYLSAAGAVTFSEAVGQAGFASSAGLDDYGTLYLADARGGSAACGGVDGGDPYTALAFTSDGGSLSQVAGLALPFSTIAGTFGVVVDANQTSYWGNNGQFFAVSAPGLGFKQVAAWPACGVTLTPAGVSAVSNLALDPFTNNSLYTYSAWETGGPDGGYTVQGNLAALNPATGAQVWIFDIPAATLPAGWTPLQSDVGNASPAIAIDGTVYVGGGLGLYAIDGASGMQQWLFPSANVSSSPAIGADGTIFFGSDDGSFYAVTSTGQLRFMVPTGGPISSSPAIGSDGTVYFVSDDGNLYAIR